MKAILTLLLFLQAYAGESASAISQQDLIGHWQFYKKIYRGIEMPEPPEATLRLHFEFYPDGTDRLFWWHEGEGDWCERIGKYSLEGQELVDEIVWVNPKNTMECARDPDMQKGRVTRTLISLEKGDLHFHLNLGDETLIYIWRKKIP